MKGTVLFVDDDTALCELASRGLGEAGFAVTTTTSGVEALELIDTQEPDVVVADLNMEGMGGLDLCARIVERHPDVPVLLITAFGSLESAIGAIRAGAYDFITKPFEVDALTVAIERATQHRALRAEVKRLRRVVEDARGLGEIVGSSPPMRDLYDLIERAAGSTRASSTPAKADGKELVARELHRRSRRSGGPFVAVNCAAIPDSLIESELFGHVKGAFTDARSARTGLFQQANGGTLFLDEIADLPLALQPKLLRALQERMIRPVGSDTETACDVRVVAATNRDLDALVRSGKFREDLFFRLAVVHVPVPPLRARGTDVLALAQRFVAQAAGETGSEVAEIAPAAAERLLAYEWPGNVRELRNAMERAVALARTNVIAVGDLPNRVAAGAPVATGTSTAESGATTFAPLDDVERRHILLVLDAMHGNKTLTEVLGIDRSLHRKLTQHARLRTESGRAWRLTRGKAQRRAPARSDRPCGTRRHASCSPRTACTPRNIPSPQPRAPGARTSSSPRTTRRCGA
jgi:two-component system response regulator HydG